MPPADEPGPITPGMSDEPPDSERGDRTGPTEPHPTDVLRVA